MINSDTVNVINNANYLINSGMLNLLSKVNHMINSDMINNAKNMINSETS